MEPLITLVDRDLGAGILIPELQRLYGGNISLPLPPDDRPYIAMNFVKTIDGLITFAIPGQEGGGEISGRNPHDTFVMGLLRSIFGDVAEGANAIRKNPKHLWTPGYISPEFTESFTKQSQQFKEKILYRTFFVTGSGNLKPEQKPGFSNPEIPEVMRSTESEVWVLTTHKGRERLLHDYPPEEFPDLRERVLPFGNNGKFELKLALRYLRQEMEIKYLLVEGGARFAGSLVSELLYDELFLTESDLIAGNTDDSGRLTFVWGKLFNPENAPKHKLISVKKDGEKGNFIFTRRRRI
jgi:hypothetical protein